MGSHPKNKKIHQAQINLASMCHLNIYFHINTIVSCSLCVYIQTDVMNKACADNKCMFFFNVLFNMLIVFISCFEFNFMFVFIVTMKWDIIVIFNKLVITTIINKIQNMYVHVFKCYNSPTCCYNSQLTYCV